MFELQGSIENIGKDENGLEKICFAPMMPADEKPSETSRCVVQSLFGYFENSIEKFKSNIPGGNYLIRLDKCLE